MSMTDPIADLLTRIRNGQTARHDVVDVPASRMKREIVKILEQEGYIAGHDFSDEGPQGVIRVRLKYTRGVDQTITGIHRVSTPGRRVYCGKGQIPKVLNGLGITIISTSKGVKTGSACRREGIGGEVLCNIW